MVADLPVGENLQDHIITGMDMITLEKSLGLTFMDFISPLNIYKYFFKGSGKMKQNRDCGIFFNIHNEH